MFAITICGIFCYRKEIKVLEILFGVSLSAVVLLFYHSNPGHIALQEFPNIIKNFRNVKRMVQLKLFCEANKVVLFGLLNYLKVLFWYSDKFYLEKFKKIFVGAYGKKIVRSIYIFDKKLQVSYCFILWKAGIFPVAFVMNHKLPF